MTHRRVDDRTEREYRRQHVSPPPMFARVDLVDAAKELERIARRQLIPELGTLPEHGADLKREQTTLPRRHEAEDAYLARIRLQDPRKHLQRRRLAGAVGTDKCYAFTGRDRERQPVDRGDRPR